MGIASLVLGIVSLIMSFIPFVGIFFVITAVVGIILGIVSLCKKQDKGKSIAGIITSTIAIIITIVYCFVIWGLIAGDNGILEQAKKVVEEAENNEKINSSLEDNNEPVKSYAVGEKYQDDKISISFLSKDENFTEYSQETTIEEGYKVIKAEFEFENLGVSSQYISSYDFDCYADGYDCDSFWSPDNSSFSATISSGKKTKGTVYFQVPADSESITLEYSLNYLKDKRVEFVIK